jgi:hypothetical protein
MISLRKACGKQCGKERTGFSEADRDTDHGSHHRGRNPIQSVHFFSLPSVFAGTETYFSFFFFGQASEPVQEYHAQLIGLAPLFDDCLITVLFYNCRILLSIVS